MAKKTKNTNKLLRYRVTQPEVRGSSHALFPEYTTRIGSNESYIFAANHPEWHAAATREEDGLVQHMSEEAVRYSFTSQLKLLAELTPITLFGFVLIRLMRQYSDRHMNRNEEIRVALNNALGTVANNMAQVIFEDPRQLAGDDYTLIDFIRWERNMQNFESMDVFAYRPGEHGKDLDGHKKEIIELCPAPKLGRHLVRVGYELLRDHVATKCRGQAALADIFAGLQPRRVEMSVCLLPAGRGG